MKNQKEFEMSETKKCESCKFFVGEMFRSINPELGYCDNPDSPYHKKKVERSNPVCENFSE
jgi:hypothetical protein